MKNFIFVFVGFLFFMFAIMGHRDPATGNYYGVVGSILGAFIDPNDMVDNNIGSGSGG